MFCEIPNQIEDSLQQKKHENLTFSHSQSCHHQFQLNLSHLPLLLDSPPTSKALHPPLHSWQVHSNLIKTSWLGSNFWIEILKNSTCSNHSSLSSMPGLFGPSSTILLPHSTLLVISIFWVVPTEWIYFGFFLNQNINVLRLPWRYTV